MDLDGGSSSTVSTRVQAIPGRPTRHGAFYQFTQQNLPACKPVLTPAAVISTFLMMGFIFIPVGLVTLRASHSVVEIVDRYDIDCVPEEYRSNKVAYIKDDLISKNCSRFLKVSKPMRAPIYIYYQLDNYYQNHRRYVKSRSDQQLTHGPSYKDTSSCRPLESSGVLPIVPCGLIAWSLFNDTYKFSRGPSELKVDRKNIAWKSDRNHKFGKHVYPFNFQNGTLVGGAKLDPDIPLHCHIWYQLVTFLLLLTMTTRAQSITDLERKIEEGQAEVNARIDQMNTQMNQNMYELRALLREQHSVPGNNTQQNNRGQNHLATRIGKLSDQEDLIVWMRTAALPSFRKLYGRIEEDLDADDVIVVHLKNNYNTYSFGGKKKLVLSTSGWLGGKNDFLGFANLFVGTFCILISIVFLLLHVKNPR